MTNTGIEREYPAMQAPSANPRGVSPDSTLGRWYSTMVSQGGVARKVSAALSSDLRRLQQHEQPCDGGRAAHGSQGRGSETVLETGLETSPETEPDRVSRVCLDKSPSVELKDAPRQAPSADIPKRCPEMGSREVTRDEPRDTAQRHGSETRLKGREAGNKVRRRATGRLQTKRGGLLRPYVEVFSQLALAWPPCVCCVSIASKSSVLARGETV